MQVTLSTDINKPIDKLTALVNYTQGTPLSVSVTTFTHIAAGLASNLIKSGAAVAATIDSANQRISNFTGINILTTTPLQIIDPANANITLTPELKYGFLAGAISLWVKNNAPQYTSIAFAQLAYRDIATDGLLDGMGVDSVNSPIPLGLGTTPVTLNDYRYGLAISIVQVANSTNNKTGIISSRLLSLAQDIAANTDAMFNNVATKSLVAPVISSPSNPTNGMGSKSITVTAVLTDDIGMKSTEFLLDNISLVLYTNSFTTQSYTIDTTKYSDAPHVVSIKSTNLAGLTSTKNITIIFDNTPPTSTGTASFSGGTAFFSGCVTEIGMGLESVSITSYTANYVVYSNTSVAVNTSTSCWSFSAFNFGLSSSTSNLPASFVMKDKAGYCSYYEARIYPVWTFISSDPC